MVSSQSDVGLLGTVWSNQGVDLLNLDIVQLLNGSLDLVLVGLQGNLENQGVTVLDLLDGGLRGNWGLDDLVGIQSSVVRNGGSSVSWLSGQLQGVWKSEGGVGSHLGGLLGVGTLQSRFLSSSSVWRLVTAQNLWRESDMSYFQERGRYSCVLTDSGVELGCVKKLLHREAKGNISWKTSLGNNSLWTINSMRSSEALRVSSCSIFTYLEPSRIVVIQK